jgi:hypothetical protein
MTPLGAILIGVVSLSVVAGLIIWRVMTAASHSTTVDAIHSWRDLGAAVKQLPAGTWVSLAGTLGLLAYVMLWHPLP